MDDSSALLTTMVLQLKIGVLRSFVLHWSFLYFFSRMIIPMSKIRGFNGNKNDFIHALRAFFVFFVLFIFVLFFFSNAVCKR